MGTRRDGRPSLFSPVYPPFCANALACDLNYSTDLKRKVGLQRVSRRNVNLPKVSPRVADRPDDVSWPNAHTRYIAVHVVV